MDTYSRALDMPNVRHSELRPPLAPAHARSRAFTINFFPEQYRVVSKSNTFDITKAVGTTNLNRAWLADVCRIVRAVPRGPSEYLLQLTTARYTALWHFACQLAKLPRANLRRSRHGRTSADALDDLGDAEMLERGSR